MRSKKSDWALKFPRFQTRCPKCGAVIQHPNYIFRGRFALPRLPKDGKRETIESVRLTNGDATDLEEGEADASK